MESSSPAEHLEMNNEDAYVNQAVDNANVELHNSDSDENSDIGDYSSPNLPKVESNNMKPHEESVTVNLTELTEISEISDDPEVQFAKTIIEGDLEAVKESLKIIKDNHSTALLSINSSKIHHLTPNAIQTLDLEKVSPLDLAAHYDHGEIIDYLLEYNIENVTQFEQALKSQEFFHTNIIFDRMIVKCPKLSEELLNQKISTNHFENDCESRETTHLALDFGLFHTKNESTAESLPNLRMLDEGHRELIKQPLSEAFICLKWQKLNWVFYLAFVYRFTLAILVTLLAFAEVSRHPIFVKWAPMTRPGLTWLLLAFYLPALLQLVFTVIHKKADFFISSWFYLQRPFPALPVPSLSCVVQCGLLTFILAFLVLILTNNGETSDTELVHISAWTVFFAWIFCVIKVSECPCLGIYMYILQVVLQDILAFFVSMLALLLGFAFSFHLIIGRGDEENSIGYNSPISAFLSILTSIVGHYSHKGHSNINGEDHVPGTSEVLFVILFLVLSIGAMNILIGLCVANIKDIMMQKEDFKLGQMIINNVNTEETLLLLAKLFKKCLPCFHSGLLKQASLLYSDGDKNGQNCLFKVLPYATKPQKRSKRRPISVLPLRFGNSTRITNMQVIQTRIPVDLDEDKEKGDEMETCRKTNFTLPGWIWENAMTILEEKHEFERAQAEEERSRLANQNDDYTSLYWNPEGGEGVAKSENEYEVVEENNSNLFGGGMLRGIRESLLRELRRDLAKFIQPKEYGARDRRSGKNQDRSGKSVNLRPGLALGVITLQAGSPHRATMH